MTDDLMDRLPAYNRVSIRAVLVSEGQDPSTALAEAGFANPVALSVVVGEAVDLPGGILGDGMTPNLVALLETEQEDGFDTAQPGARSDPGRSVPVPSNPVTTTLPPAFGSQPLAPVRKRGT
jgi:hypothetical protein